MTVSPVSLLQSFVSGVGCVRSGFRSDGRDFLGEVDWDCVRCRVHLDCLDETDWDCDRSGFRLDGLDFLGEVDWDYARSGFRSDDRGSPGVADWGCDRCGGHVHVHVREGHLALGEERAVREWAAGASFHEELVERREPRSRQ